MYFIQATTGGVVKIGHSKNVEARREQLEVCYGRPLIVLHVMEGGRAEELSVHERFWHHRLGKSEQFRPGADLMRFIGRSPVDGAESVKRMRPVMPVPFYASAAFVRLVNQAARERGMTVANLMREFVDPYLDELHREYVETESQRLAS